MEKYTEQKFDIPELKGISRKAVDEHVKLYAGYVKNANLINEKIVEYMKEGDTHAYALGELQRRFSFEFNGMRNHEYYFKSLEGGAQALASGTGADGSALRAQIEKDFAVFGGFDGWLNTFKAIGTTRGIGWAMLYWDAHTSRLTHAWVDEQHLGQLNGLQLILGLDMWEHAFLFDFVPSEKKKYIDAFFDNLNWSVIEENFAAATKGK